jgi:hypothetical protein
MNRQNLMCLITCNVVTTGLLIEYFCGVPHSLELLCVSTVVSLIAHICVLKDHVRLSRFVKEDYTR